MTNLDRMRSGKAPVGPDNEPVSLHHLLQDEPGPIAEVGGAFHSRYTGVLHSPQVEKVAGQWAPRKNYSFRAHDGRRSQWPKSPRGNVLKTDAEKAFNRWSSAYWKVRAKGLK